MAPRPPNLVARWPPDFSSEVLKISKLRGRSFKNEQILTWRQDDSQTSNLGPRWLPDPSTWTQDGLQASQLGAIKVHNSCGRSFKNKQIAWEVLQKWPLS